MHCICMKKRMMGPVKEAINNTVLTLQKYFLSGKDVSKVDMKSSDANLELKDSYPIEWVGSENLLKTDNCEFQLMYSVRLKLNSDVENSEIGNYMLCASSCIDFVKRVECIVSSGSLFMHVYMGTSGDESNIKSPQFVADNDFNNTQSSDFSTLSRQSLLPNGQRIILGHIPDFNGFFLDIPESGDKKELVSWQNDVDLSDPHSWHCALENHHRDHNSCCSEDNMRDEMKVKLRSSFRYQGEIDDCRQKQEVMMNKTQEEQEVRNEVRRKEGHQPNTGEHSLQTCTMYSRTEEFCHCCFIYMGNMESQTPIIAEKYLQNKALKKIDLRTSSPRAADTDRQVKHQLCKIVEENKSSDRTSVHFLKYYYLESKKVLKDKMPVGSNIKSLCEGAIRESVVVGNSFNKFKMMRESNRLKVHLRDMVKFLGQKDLKTPVPGKGDEVSFLDILRDFGLIFKYLPGSHVFQQEFVAYPLDLPQGGLRHLMHYEVLRLSSFSHGELPENCDVGLTQLAEAGFYRANESGRIICFDCGQEFQGSVNSEDAHRPGCLHRQHNRPLHMWTQGLTEDDMLVYRSGYGNLRPLNFRTSYSNRDEFEHAGDSESARAGLDSAPPESQTNTGSEQKLANASPESGPGTSAPGVAHRDEPDFEDGIRPSYHSDTVPSVMDGASHDIQSHSLPPNLNEVSGVVVQEESQDSDGTPHVLTSAATLPVPLHNRSIQDGQSQQADGGGAVGGTYPTLDLNKASYPLFSNAAARRQSFSTWSPDHSHRPDDLVAAGFFYAGYADCVRCFYCGLGLKYWRSTDIPAYQHARYRPHCVYNRLYKGQEYIDRVQQDIQSEQGATNQTTSGPQGAPSSAPTSVPAPTTAPRSTDPMSSAAAQEALESGWQRDQVQQAVNHIIRDFGESCLEIGLLLDVLRNLNVRDNARGNLPSGDSVGSGDSGINENVANPANLGSNGTEVGQGADASDSVLEGAQASAALVQQPAPPQLDFVEVFRSVEREHTLLAERIRCRLCHSKPVSCIFLPCGHVIACQECADLATHCLFCSKQIIGTANIFLA